MRKTLSQIGRAAVERLEAQLPYGKLKPETEDDTFARAVQREVFRRLSHFLDEYGVAYPPLRAINAHIAAQRRA